MSPEEKETPSARYYCPICGSVPEKFLPFGLRPRPNALCPACGSLERHRLIWLYFKNKTNLFHDRLKVLHVAPETVISRKLKDLPNLDYLSADISMESAMVKMDITDIACPDDAFDVIYASHVLEHIPDDLKAMSELRRVLKPSGWAILQVPIYGDRTLEDPSATSPEERERLFGQKDHVRRYGHDGVYKTRLEKAGFIVHVDNYVRSLGQDVVSMYGLTSGEDIYFCTKARGDRPQKSCKSREQH